MKAWVETKACNTVKTAVEFRLNLSVLWKDIEKDNVQFVVGCLQLYPDKSQAFLSASLYGLLSLHLKLLIFGEDMRLNFFYLGASWLRICLLATVRVKKHRVKELEDCVGLVLSTAVITM